MQGQGNGSLSRYDSVGCFRGKARIEGQPSVRANSYPAHPFITSRKISKRTHKRSMAGLLPENRKEPHEGTAPDLDDARWMRAGPPVLCSPPFHGGLGWPARESRFVANPSPKRNPTVACAPTAPEFITIPIHGRCLPPARFKAPASPSYSQCSRHASFRQSFICLSLSTLRFDASNPQSRRVGQMCRVVSRRSALAPRVIRMLNPRPSRLRWCPCAVALSFDRSGVRSQRTHIN